MCTFQHLEFTFTTQSAITYVSREKSTTSSCVSKLITYDGEKRPAKVVMKWVA